ncbi:MAG: flagellar biosynthesis protein FlhF [Burkholderiaceae bacterium]|nr:flagellar biosynthesis protein FlhF [Burkholderiaceae bacterium]
MNVRRFFARTNKDAMTKVRDELGPDAVVVRNRQVTGGVEVFAMHGEPPAAPRNEQRAPPAARTAEDEEAVPEMSTVSFQQYVRDRLAQKSAPPPTLGELLAPREQEQDDDRENVSRGGRAGAPQKVSRSGGNELEFAFAGGDPRAAHDAFPDRGAEAYAAVQAQMLAEMREMRSFIADQLASFSWFDGVRRNAAQSRMMRRLLGAGFSPALTRTIVTRMPADLDDERAESWVRQALSHNLACTDTDLMLGRGGIYALIGPTGVGKTTSTAKIAARFALKHGAQAVGLISVDAYRVGGQDQLRSFGRLLGAPVHVAHDAATLADFLHLYMNKKLILIDTAGIGQRDERVDELLASLASSNVKKLVVLNAAAQAETLDDVITAYRASQAAGIVLSKVDEAVKLGGAIDCALRHRLRIVGVANGQRVPEDWTSPQAETLIEAALSARPAADFDLEDADIGAFFQPADQAQRASSGALHA